MTDFLVGVLIGFAVLFGIYVVGSLVIDIVHFKQDTDTENRKMLVSMCPKYDQLTAHVQRMCRDEGLQPCVLHNVGDKCVFKP